MHKTQTSGKLTTVLIQLYTLSIIFVFALTLSRIQDTSYAFIGTTTVIGLSILLFLVYKIFQNNNSIDNVMEKIEKMKYQEFKNFLLVVFKKLGYKIQQTQGNENYGADLILQSNDCKIVVQAKRESDSVGIIKAVQEVIDSIKFHKADKGIIITNSEFADSAHKLASANDIELWDSPKLIEELSKFESSELIKSTYHNAKKN